MKAEGSYLDRILARTKADLPARQKQKPAAILRTLAKAAPKAPPFEQSIRRGTGLRLIAEIKRKDAAKGFIDRDLDIATVAGEFAQGGAHALAVQTEGPHFAGTIEDLTRARAAAKQLPALREDFVIDPYQLAESRVAGASAVWLVAAALPGKQLGEMLRAARELDLEALVDVHDETELDRALDAGAAMVSLDNRDLRSFAIDLGVTERLAPRAAKAGVLVVSAGGLTLEEARRLAPLGVDAFLVGEALLRAGDRAQAARSFVAG